MKTFKLFSSIILLVSGVVSVSAQQLSGNQIADNLQKASPDHPQEKIYVHLNKEHYLTGDDIWFKAYVTLGLQNRLSALSGVLYVDLIGPKNQLERQLRLPIYSGITMGDIHIPDSLEQGTYHLRAYTNWMKNFPEETFFNKKFTIGRLKPEPVIISPNFSFNEQSKLLNAVLLLKDINGTPRNNIPLEYTLLINGKASGNGKTSTDTKGHAVIPLKDNVDLRKGVLNIKALLPGNTTYKKSIKVTIPYQENKMRFMPEGGDMVGGLQSRVAFKVLQPNGLSASVNGHIEDNQGAKIIDFNSGYAGMGSFQFTPEAGKSYKAVFTSADGKTQQAPLPNVLQSGYVLTLNQSMGSSMYLAISASPSLVKNQKLTILVHKHGEVIYLAEKVINSPESLNKLSVASYPTGILQITVFDEMMQPVCERLFFNLNKTTLLPITAANKESYGPRQLVTVDLNVGATTDSLRVGTFSASVVNLSGVPPVRTDEMGILSGLLLNPELKGYIEHPDYYFENYNSDKQRELDNLILTQGWRRINWKDVSAGKKQEIAFQPEHGFSVSGKITRPNGDPVPKAKVSLLSTETWRAIDTLSDAQGRFVFDKLFLRDSSTFTIQAKDPNGKKNIVVKLDKQPASSKYITLDEFQYSIHDDNYLAFIKNNFSQLPDSVKRLLNGSNLLNQVVIKAKKVNKASPNSSNLNGPGVADQVFSAEDFETSATLKQFLEGRAMGVRFEGDYPVSTRNGDTIRLIVDGMTTDADALTTMNVADVQSIEILRNTALTFIYGRTGGIIIVTTKTGQGAKRVIFPSPDNVKIVLNGFNPIREFYSPDYTVTNSSVPDHRTAIYWKPNVVTDKEGKASFSFYTSDDKGTYQLRIEGMNADGRMGHLVKGIKVE